MAKRMAKMHQGTHDETILSVSRRKAEDKDQNHPECCRDAARTREDEGLPSPFQGKRGSTLRLPTRRSDVRPPYL